MDLRLLKVGRRALLGFKEKPNGGNVTYDCSPSGPCVPCAYSEKVSFVQSFIKLIYGICFQF